MEIFTKLIGWLLEKSWKFIFAVVVPVTVWFTLINKTLADVKAAQVAHAVRMDVIEASAKVDKEKADDKLDKLIFLVAEIKGELKRIKSK